MWRVKRRNNLVTRRRLSRKHQLSEITKSDVATAPEPTLDAHELTQQRTQVVNEDIISLLQKANAELQKTVEEQELRMCKADEKLRLLQQRIDQLAAENGVKISEMELEIQNHRDENEMLACKIHELTRRTDSLNEVCHKKDQLIAVNNQEIFQQSIKIEELNGALKEVQISRQELVQNADNETAKVLVDHALRSAQISLAKEAADKASQDEMFELTGVLTQAKEHNEALEVQLVKVEAERNEMKEIIEENKMVSCAQINELEIENLKLQSVLRELQEDVEEIKADTFCMKENFEEEIMWTSADQDKIIKKSIGIHQNNFDAIKQQGDNLIDELKERQEGEILELKKRQMVLRGNLKEREEKFIEAMEGSSCKYCFGKPKVKIASVIRQLKDINVYIEEEISSSM